MIATRSDDRLADWVAPETWHSGKAVDEQRFFQFVNALWLEHGSWIDESDLFARIVDAVTDYHLDLLPEALERAIDKHVCQAQLILRYNQAIADAVQ